MDSNNNIKITHIAAITRPLDVSSFCKLRYKNRTVANSVRYNIILWTYNCENWYNCDLQCIYMYLPCYTSVMWSNNNCDLAQQMHMYMFIISDQVWGNWPCSYNKWNAFYIGYIHTLSKHSDKITRGRQVCFSTQIFLGYVKHWKASTDGEGFLGALIWWHGPRLSPTQ